MPSRENIIRICHVVLLTINAFDHFLPLLSFIFPWKLLISSHDKNKHENAWNFANNLLSSILNVFWWTLNRLIRLNRTVTSNKKTVYTISSKNSEPVTKSWWWENFQTVFSLKQTLKFHGISSTFFDLSDFMGNFISLCHKRRKFIISLLCHIFTKLTRAKSHKEQCHFDEWLHWDLNTCNLWLFQSTCLP